MSKLETIYYRCDVSNNRTEEPMSLSEFEQAIIDLFLGLAESCQSKDGFGQTIIVPAELRTKIQALSNKEAK